MEISLSNGGKKSKVIPDFIQSSFIQSKEFIDLKSVADSVFLLEEDLMARDKIQNVKYISIPLYNGNEKLANLLEDFLMFLFNRPIEVKFHRNTQKTPQSIPLNTIKGYSCLFSGGLDSLSGILNSLKNYKDVEGCFTLHKDQRLSKVIDRFKNSGIHVTQINSPRHGTIFRPSRGFSYMLNTTLFGRKNIIIPECGTTMYQPKFTLLDDVTYTTHPKVVEFTRKVIKEISGININFIMPNENLTKAEIAISCPNKELIKATSSCRTTMYCNDKKPQEGTCYGCINRRLSLVVADIKDSECRTDILTKDKIKRKHYGNILPLLEFCLDFLKNPDDLPSFSRKIIYDYRKEELFRRWCLEIFAGLMILKRNGELRDKILRSYLDKALHLVSNDEFENRIGNVREGKFKPSFDS